MNMPQSLAAGLLILIASGGCQNIARPNWSHPGSAQSQQCQALRYDPYPENDIGPTMVGARPASTKTRRPKPLAPGGS